MKTHLISSLVLTALSVVALATLGCSADSSSLEEGGGDEAPAGAEPGTTPEDPTKNYGVAYTGFGDSQLAASRVDNPKGNDRSRVKPFSALQTEFVRVIGAKPASLDAAGPTFGRAPANWYVEPQASAISLITAYSVAFDGCLTYTGKPEFAQAPTEASASTQCKTMTRKFWSRDATPEELAACSAVALKDSAKEPDASRRWAYTCASVLTASGFLAY